MTILSKCEQCEHVYPSDLDACTKCKTPQAFSTPATVGSKYWVYDLETYPNIFTALFIHADSGQERLFEISDRRNDHEELVQFVIGLQNSESLGVGFNNVGFDYPVLHMMVNHPAPTAHDAFVKANAIIGAFNRWEHNVWDKDQLFGQVDLYKIHHFDNQAKSTSLKALEIVMRSKNVVDLPYKPGTSLEPHQMDELIAYNRVDVKETAKFFARSLDMINLRIKLSERYNRNMINMCNTKMGETILVTEMEKAGIECYYKDATGRKSPRQTIRESINLGEILHPYIVFERPEFNIILEFFKNKIITATKGVFSDIDVTDWPESWLCPKEQWPDKFNIKERNGRLIASKLHIQVDGVVYWFGTGGIHASVMSQIVSSDDNNIILDDDVTSFYPRQAIVNGMFPAHLGEPYVPAYNDIFDERTTYPKGTPENAGLKEALNASFGNSNNEFSCLFDPLYTMKTTINGQLMLCMLTEQMLKIPNCEVIQANTDGITYKIPKKYHEHSLNVGKWWEGVTGLNLEQAQYSRMFIRDVNNYIAEYTDGKLKRKGAYEYNVQWHQNPSSLVVAKAVEANLVHGVPVEEFIKGHKDAYDFMNRLKAPRSNNVYMEYPDFNARVQLQNTSRYYVALNGGYIVKEAPPTGQDGTWKRANGVSESMYQACIAERVGSDYDAAGQPHDPRIHTRNKSKHQTRRLSECAGWRTQDCADVADFDWNNLNYQWYIQEAEKLINPLLTVSS